MSSQFALRRAPLGSLPSSNTLNQRPNGLEDFSDAQLALAMPIRGQTCKKSIDGTSVCSNPAVKRNRGMCVHHGTFFVPKGKAAGTLCLGREFLRGGKDPKLCSCGKLKCREIGYPNDGLFRFPADEAHAKQWAQALVGANAIEQQRRVVDDRRNIRIAYWHFHEEHRFKNQLGKWELRESIDSFKDNEGKVWRPGVVPLKSLDSFIQETKSHRTPKLRLPPAESMTPVSWQSTVAPFYTLPSIMLATPHQSASITPPIGSESSTNMRVGDIYPSPVRKRIKSLENELQNERNLLLNERNRNLRLESAYRQISSDHLITRQKMADVHKELEKTLYEKKEGEREAAENCKHAYEHGLKEMEARWKEKFDKAEKEWALALVEAKKMTLGLRYEHFLDKGHMSKHVNVFFHFPSIHIIEAFLNAINIKRDDEDEGICSRLLRYSLVSRKERSAKEKLKDNVGDDNDVVVVNSSGPGKRGAPQKLHWKDEYLIFSTIHRGGLSQKQAESIFMVSDTLIGDIVHQYAVYLDRFFEKTMPNPKASEILSCYPDRFIFQFGHARIKMLLDCCDQSFEDPRFRAAHSVLYSVYHAQTGLKFGVGSTPTGVVPHSWCTEGYPSSLTDPNLVEASKVIKNNLRFGDIVEVDKAFLIECQCALLGIQVQRPTTMRDKQRQQSRGDTEKTQEVGNTRIIIEQVNRQGKSENRYFRGPVPISSKNIVSQMMRVGFMFANFKPAFIASQKSTS